MRLPDTLATDRMILRRLQLSDAESLYTHCFQHAEHLRFMSYVPHSGVADTQAYIKNSQARWEVGDRKEYAMVERLTHQVIGVIGIYITLGRCSLGAAVAPAYSGHGLVREACRRVIAFLQRQPWVTRIWAFCEGGHQRSCHVLRVIGFVEEGRVHSWSTFPQLGDEPRDCIFFYFPRTPLLPEGRKGEQPEEG